MILPPYSTNSLPFLQSSIICPLCSCTHVQSLSLMYFCRFYLENSCNINLCLCPNQPMITHLFDSRVSYMSGPPESPGHTPMYCPLLNTVSVPSIFVEVKFVLETFRLTRRSSSGLSPVHSSFLLSVACL